MRAGTDRVPRRRLPSLALGGLAVLVAGAFATALLVLPVKAWMNQRHALSSSSTELQALEEANRGLQADVDRLRTRPGIAQAAREELGVVKSAGWNQKLLAAGAGDVAYWRARAAVWMHDDGNTPVMQVELELVRSFFEPQAPPATIDFSLFPYIEAEFMRKVQKQIAEGSQP